MILRFKSHLIVAVFFAVATASPAIAEVRVVDGDTLEIDGITFRIAGIDAPETGQNCESARGSWPCGKAAASRLASLVLGQEVVCTRDDVDQYGRIIGPCHVGDTDLAQIMVTDGLAWAYRQYSMDYAPQEDLARSEHIGVWEKPNQPPWQFRKERWEKAVAETPKPGCPIKGNISAHGHIYHTPWSPWYERTRVSEAKGERWFRDEREAVQAGWRAPHWP
ncbi:MAG: thermonuclease family protein [Pseudomonadota bacterium]